MAEKIKTFDTSVVSYTGIFSFPDFYAYCKNWIMSEIDPNEFEEGTYSEKTPPAGKLIDITWTFRKKFTNYFAFDGVVKFRTIDMKTVEIKKNNKKIKMNQGEVSVKLIGKLVTDYQNQFDRSEIFQKWRGVYNKWMIKARVDRFEDKVTDFSDRFMVDAKAFLEMEGKR